MKILRHPTELEEIEHAGIRDLIQARIEMIEESDFYDPDVYGAFVIAEPGDSLAALEMETFKPLLGEPPCFESLLDHGEFYDAVWPLVGDQCVTLVVPKLPGVPMGLLDLCVRYAEPVPEGLDE